MDSFLYYSFFSPKYGLTILYFLTFVFLFIGFFSFRNKRDTIQRYLEINNLMLAIQQIGFVAWLIAPMFPNLTNFWELFHFMNEGNRYTPIDIVFYFLFWFILTPMVQFFWFKTWRGNWRFTTAINTALFAIFFGEKFRLYFLSLQEDYLPSSWNYIDSDYLPAVTFTIAYWGLIYLVDVLLYKNRQS